MLLRRWVGEEERLLTRVALFANGQDSFISSVISSLDSSTPIFETSLESAENRAKRKRIFRDQNERRRSFRGGRSSVPMLRYAASNKFMWPR